MFIFLLELLRSVVFLLRWHINSYWLVELLGRLLVVIHWCFLIHLLLLRYLKLNVFRWAVCSCRLVKFLWCFIIFKRNYLLVKLVWCLKCVIFRRNNLLVKLLIIVIRGTKCSLLILFFVKLFLISENWRFSIDWLFLFWLQVNWH